MELAFSKAKSVAASYSKLEDMGDVYEFECNDPKNGPQKRLVTSFSEGNAYRGSHLLNVVKDLLIKIIY